jgi:hypothetical protein
LIGARVVVGWTLRDGGSGIAEAQERLKADGSRRQRCSRRSAHTTEELSSIRGIGFTHLDVPYLKKIRREESLEQSATLSKTLGADERGEKFPFAHQSLVDTEKALVVVRAGNGVHNAVGLLYFFFLLAD